VLPRTTRRSNMMFVGIADGSSSRYCSKQDIHEARCRARQSSCSSVQGVCPGVLQSALVQCLQTLFGEATMCGSPCLCEHEAHGSGALTSKAQLVMHTQTLCWWCPGSLLLTLARLCCTAFGSAACEYSCCCVCVDCGILYSWPSLCCSTPGMELLLCMSRRVPFFWRTLDLIRWWMYCLWYVAVLFHHPRAL
jgi:hypothetical protein